MGVVEVKTFNKINYLAAGSGPVQMMTRAGHGLSNLISFE